jgi:cytochrome c oxidase assembly protein subunit 15
VNRLVGVAIGILVLLTLIYSVPYRKQDPPVFYWSLAVFLLVGFQGWLGARVVASDLKPLLITAHMIAAFLIVALLIYTVTRSQHGILARLDVRAIPPRYHSVLFAAIAMTLLQVAMGTQIRESVDAITNAALISERNLWREHFPIIFYIHRSFSAVILFTNLYLAWTLLRRLGPGRRLRIPAYALAGLVVAAVCSGISLDRLGFPAVAQPLHLLLANLIFGCQFFLFLALHYAQGQLAVRSEHGVVQLSPDRSGDLDLAGRSEA